MVSMRKMNVYICVLGTCKHSVSSHGGVLSISEHCSVLFGLILVCNVSGGL